MTKFFEYKEVKHVDYIKIDEMNLLGREGWELILCDAGSYIFKREITDTLKNDPWGDIGIEKNKPFQYE
jgi:hypothetical protein